MTVSGVHEVATLRPNRVHRVVDVDGTVVLHGTTTHVTGQRQRDVLGLVGQRAGADRSEEHTTHLEQGNIGHALGAVAGDRAQESRQHCGAQHRLLGPQWVGGPHDAIQWRAGTLEIGR